MCGGVGVDGCGCGFDFCVGVGDEVVVYFVVMLDCGGCIDCCDWFCIGCGGGNVVVVVVGLCCCCVWYGFCVF